MTNASVDFGNTRVKIGIFENQKLLDVFRIGTLAETAELLKSYPVENAIVSSVTMPSIEISKELKMLKSLLFLNSNTPLPIKNNYSTPITLGYDRIAAAVGANHRFPNQNCLIIDIGTTIKYDLVTAQNTFEGGIISPGKQMRFKALHTFTKKLPLLTSETIPDLIGNSTESCIQSGVMNGIVAEINGIIEKYVKKQSVKVIICGGDASNFESQINYPTFAAPNLVLEGLNRILYYNVKNT